MDLVRGSSRAATVVVYIMIMWHGGADSLRHGHRGSVVLHPRRLRRVARGRSITVRIGGTAADAEAADSKKQGLLQ